MLGGGCGLRAASLRAAGNNFAHATCGEDFERLKVAMPAMTLDFWTGSSALLGAEPYHPQCADIDGGGVFPREEGRVHDVLETLELSDEPPGPPIPRAIGVVGRGRDKRNMAMG